MRAQRAASAMKEERWKE